MTATQTAPLRWRLWCTCGAGGDVVEVRSALPPTAVHAPSLTALPLSSPFSACVRSLYTRALAARCRCGCLF